MADAKRISSYAAGFLAVIAVALLVDLSTALRLIIFVTGIIILLLFRFTVDRPHIEPWLEKRRLGKVRLTPEQKADLHRRLLGKADDVRTAAEKVKEEEPVVEKLSKVVMDMLAKHTVRKETVGGMIQELAGLHKEGFDSAYERFVSEVAKEKSLTERLVSSWEEEHADLARHLEYLQRNSKRLSENLEELRSAREEYRIMLEQGGVEGREKELEHLERSVKRVLKEDTDDIDVLSKESARIAAMINRLGKRMDEMRALAAAVGREVGSAEKTKDYEDIVRRMQKLSGRGGINDRMVVALHDNRMVINQLVSELVHVRDVLSDVKDRQLTEERVLSQVKAEEAAKEAAEKRKMIAELEKKEAAADKRIRQLESEVEAKEQRLAGIEGPLKALDERLRKVREAAENDPGEMSKVSEAVQEVLKETGDRRNSVVDLMVSLSRETSLLDRRYLDSAEELKTAESMRDLLVTENEQLIEATKRSKKEIEEANRKIGEYKRKVSELSTELQKAAESDRKSIQARIDSINSRMIKLHNQVDDAAVALADLPKEMAPLDGSIRDAEQLIEELRPKLERLKESKRESDDRLAAVQAQLDSVEKESKARIDELNRRNKELEDRLDKAVQRLKGLDKEIVGYQQQVEHLEDELSRMPGEEFEEKVRTIEELERRMQSSEKREQEQRKTIESLNQNLAELERKKQEEISNLSNIIVGYEEKLANLEAEAEYLRSTVQSHRRLEDELKKHYKDTQEELRQARAELEGSKKEESEKVKALRQKVGVLEEDLKEKSDSLNNVAKAANELSYKESRARKDTEKVRSELEKARQKFRVKQSEMEKDIQELRDEKAALTETVDGQKGRIAELESDVQALRQGIEESMEKETGLQERIKELESGLASAEGAATGKEASLRLQIKKLKQELEKVASESARLLKEKESKTVEIADAFRELQEKHRRLGIVNEKLGASAGPLLRSAKERIDRLSADRDRLAEENRRLQKRAQDALARYRAASQEGDEQVAILKADYEKAQERLKESAGRISNLDAEKKVAEERIHELEQELQNEKVALQALQEEFERISSESRSAEEETWYDEMILHLTGRFEDAKGKLESVPDESLRIARQGAAAARELREFCLKKNRPTIIINELIKEFDSIVAMVSGYNRRKGKEAEMEVAAGSKTDRPKVIAVGDAHGDLDRLRDVMIRSGVIDRDNNWASEGGKVVLLGDYIDRGPETFELLNFIMRLKKEAGDDLVLLIGNHEAMFLGAFDWAGYDDTDQGRAALEDYRDRKSLFFSEVQRLKREKRRELTDSEKSELGRRGFRAKRKNAKGLFFKRIRETEETVHFDYRLFQRLETLKEQWLRNETKNFTIESNLCRELGWPGVKSANKAFEKFRDPREFLKLSYKGMPLRDYIRFLRENLESYHEDEDHGVLFVHAGIPYHVTNADSTDWKVERKFQGYFTRKELMTSLRNIREAARERSIGFWMAFGEGSPLFACHPADRSREWDRLPQFSDDMVRELGFKAVVSGHAQHDPRTDKGSSTSEESNRRLYENTPRRAYNIDFGMSEAYDVQCPSSRGGWLEVFDRGLIKVKVLYKASQEAVEYPFRYDG